MFFLVIDIIPIIVLVKIIIVLVKIIIFHRHFLFCHCSLLLILLLFYFLFAFFFFLYFFFLSLFFFLLLLEEKPAGRTRAATEAGGSGEKLSKGMSFLLRHRDVIRVLPGKLTECEQNVLCTMCKTIF